jgi:hypothetical protein
MYRKEDAMRTHRARRGILAVAAMLTALTLSAPAQADSVTDWNKNASDVVHGIAMQGAPSIPHLAMVHAAVYDAVNAIDRRHQPYVSMPRAKSWYSKDAAVATAAYRVLVNDGAPVVPAAQLPAVITLIQPRYDAALAMIPDGRAKKGGIAVGKMAAAALLKARKGDGRFGPFRFPVGTMVPQWRPEPEGSTNDPGAWLKDVRPFLVRNSSQFAGAPPLALTSRRYTKEFNEVKDVGAANSATRTADQTHAARFWGLNTNATVTWSGILRTVAVQEGHPVAENARLFAKAYTAAADGLITTWTDKARYVFWRPLTAIHLADGDGNPRTEADPAWTSLITAPPYPEHPSGLSTLGGALVRSLQDFYGTDKVAFSSTASNGLTRHYTRFSQAAEEIVDARVWSGIHFRFGDEQGAKIGRNVARWADKRYFRDVRCHRHH